MTKRMLLSALLVAAISLSAQGEVVSVDFNLDQQYSVAMVGAAAIGAGGDVWNGIDCGTGTAAASFTTFTTGALVDTGSNATALTLTIGGTDIRYFGSITRSPNDLMYDHLAPAWPGGTVTVNNVTPGREYTLYLYGAGLDGAGGRFTVDGVAKTTSGAAQTSGLVEGQDYVVYNVTPTGSTIDIAYGYDEFQSEGPVFNGLQIDIAPPGDLREWNVSGMGDWNVAENWLPSAVPSGGTKTAKFGAIIGEVDTTVVTDEDVTLKGIQFDNALASYNIAGHGEVTLQADTGAATIDVVSGDHQFQVAVVMASDTNVTVTNGSLAFEGAVDNSTINLTVSGDVSFNNSLAVALTGSTTTAGTVTVTGTATVGGGDLLINQDAHTGVAGDSWTIMSATVALISSLVAPEGFTLAVENGTDLVLTVAGALTPGDANGDGHVDLQDFSLLKANFGATTGAEWGDGDFNNDGAVDLQDFSLLKANFGTAGQAVPEPATMSLLALAGLGLVRRKRN